MGLISIFWTVLERVGYLERSSTTSSPLGRGPVELRVSYSYCRLSYAVSNHGFYFRERKSIWVSNELDVSGIETTSCDVDEATESEDLAKPTKTYNNCKHTSRICR